MKHLLDIEKLTAEDVSGLITQAIRFKTRAAYPQYPMFPVATLFYENSTRTRISFELAARHLGFPVVNFELQNSSESKGEIIEDTIQTLMAMGIRVFVIRHPKEGMPAFLAERFGASACFINAGDGKNAHPSQALLDCLTIIEKKPDLSRLKIAIVGDLRHSRVANSFQSIAKTMGVGELVLVSPVIWRPEKVIYGRVTASLEEGLTQADVVMCLRVQHERLENSTEFDLATYRRDFALTKTSLALAKPDALVMHPGPLNRGVEVDSDVADGPQSVILQQVQNGVFMRMAILDKLADREGAILA